MKKVILLLTVVALCLCLATPAMAAMTGLHVTFVPSITYKESPEVEDAEIETDDGKKPAKDCVVITSIPEAKDESTDISQEERDTLIDLYEQIVEGEIELPIDDDDVVRDLIDVSFEYEDCVLDPEHPDKEAIVNDTDKTLTVTIDLGVDPATDVTILTYHDGEWVPAKEVTNNGDGTVTVVFDVIGPTAIIVDGDGGFENPKTGDPAGNQLYLWVGLMVVSAAAIVALTVLKAKKRS